ncbi:MAG: LD-carboxypeptidase [Desulfobacteraceae bacterium]|nr:LD-carboxypeptidase [Desulfobacteraceae bacterium]
MTHCRDIPACTRPAPLQAGDRVGVVAPASPFDRDRFLQGLEVLRDMGFDPVWSDRLFLKNGYYAGSRRQRADDLQAFFAASDIRAVWCVRGGYGSLGILECLDYALIEKHPKIFVGCSDITNLLVTISRRCCMPTFHGPMVVSLADADKPTIEGIARALTGFGAVKIRAENGCMIRPGKAAGCVLGGNLSTFCHLLATPYFPDLTGCILFVEDTGEKPYRIDRMLTQMRMAGCFDHLAGVAAGSFTNCGSKEQIHRVFADVFDGFAFPVVCGFPAGHGRPNMVLPMGIAASLDSDTMTLTYSEPAVAAPCRDSGLS